MLSVLAKGEAYGLQILDRANQVGEVVSDGALGITGLQEPRRRC